MINHFAKYPALKALIPIIFGILFQGILELHVQPLQIFVILSIFLMLLFFLRNYEYNFITQTVLLAFIGYSASSLSNFDNTRLNSSRWADNEITTVGNVTAVSKGKSEWIDISVDGVIVNDSDLVKDRLKIRIRLPESLNFVGYGDSIALRGRLNLPRGRRNPGEFDISKYFRSIGINAYISEKNLDSINLISKRDNRLSISDGTYSIRESLQNSVNQILSPESSSVISAILLGNRALLSEETRDDFRKTGIIHVLAISGLHIGYIVGILFIIGSLFRFKRKPKVLFIITGIIMYAYLIGWKTPVTRASIMAIILLVGIISERRHLPLNTLGIAAIIILLLKPAELFQPGFQLSFAAVASIIFFKERFGDKIRLPKPTNGYRRILRWIILLYLMTLSAQVVTMPLTAYHFKNFFLTGLLLNVLIVPFVGVLVALGIVTLFFYYLYPPSGLIFAAGLDFLTKYLISLLSFFSDNFRANIVTGSFPFWLLFIILLTIFSIGFLNELKGRKWLVILVLMTLNGFVWNKALHFRGIDVYFLDVGQGDAIFIDGFATKNILIDAGRKGFGTQTGRYIISPFLLEKGIKKIDYILLSHQDADHVGGVKYLLQNFQVDSLLISYNDSKSTSYIDALSAAGELGIPVRKVKMGDTIRLGSFSNLQVYNPPGSYAYSVLQSSNNLSIVMKFTYGYSTFLFPGDIDFKAEKFLAESGFQINSEILKVPHHGSATSSSEIFLNRVSPKESVISVGMNNPYNHPSENVLTRYRSLGINYYRTDFEGALLFRSDGRSISRESWN